MPTSSNILCGCGRFMRVKQNSVTVEELMEDGSPYKKSGETVDVAVLTKNVRPRDPQAVWK